MHVLRLLILPIALACAAFCGSAGAQTLDDPAVTVPGPAPEITEIEVVTDVEGLDERRVLRELEFEVGDRLSKASAARSLRNLVASGVASQVAIYQRPVEVPLEDSFAPGHTDVPRAPSYALVIVEVVADYMVVSVDVLGDLGLAKARLKALLDQRSGEPIYEDRLLRSVYRMKDALEAAGYLGARVRLKVDRDDQKKQVAVVYQVEAGPRGAVSSVSFQRGKSDSEREFDAELSATFLEALRLKPGKAISQEGLRADRRRLERDLRKQGFLAARVDEPGTTWDPATNGVAVRYGVELGQVISVRVLNQDGEEENLRRYRRKGLLPFLGEAGFSEALLRQSEGRVEAFLQKRGYYEASVSSEQTSEPGETDVVVQIDRGPRYRIQSLDLVGNETFDRDHLDPLFVTGEKKRFESGSGALVSDVFEADLRNLEAYYQLQGFDQVRVGPPQIEGTGDVLPEDGAPDPRPLHIRVPIEEGRRLMVESLRLLGAERFELTDFAPLPVVAGGPYHPQRVQDLLDRIRSEYTRLGFERAALEVETTWDETETQARLVIRVQEGRQTVIDRIVLRGNTRTRPGVIRRVLALEPDQPLNRERLLAAQRRLYGMGVFSSVTVEAGPRRQETELPRAGESREDVSPRDVIVRVAEGKRWRLGYGFGYDSEDGVGGLFSATYNNVASRGGTLRLDLRANERDQRYRLLFTDRTVGGGVVPIQYAVYRISEEISEFDSERYGFQVEASRDFGQARVGVFFDYRNVELRSNTASIDPLTGLPPSGLDVDPGEVDRRFASVEIASITSSLLLDRRDDPLIPTRGHSLSLQLEKAFPLLDADESFLKLFAHATGYLPLGSLGTLAASLRLGGIEAQKSVSEDTVSGVELVPISERFFGGGRTTHRAFDRDELGLVDRTIFGGVPIGGNGMALINIDYRFPIAGAFGGTVFLDAGNVWADYRDIDPGELRYGGGVGVRYLSPIGPIRLELGWKLDRETGESPRELFLSFGYPF